MISELLRRLRYVLRFRRHDDELRDELAFHRDMVERELRHDGHDAEEVAALARRVLGNDLAARDRSRAVWIAPGLQDLVQDLRFAFRLLTRDRAFAATAILVLGLGIGINNMMFTLVDAHTLRGLPIADAARVLSVYSIDGATERGLSFAEYRELRDSLRDVSGLAAYITAPATLGDEGRAPERLTATHTTASAFQELGIAPSLGRAFAVDDEEPGAAAVVILGTHTWQDRYAADPQILGRTVLLNGQPATVIGVMPPRSGFPSVAEIWSPLAQLPGIDAQPRTARTLSVFGRVRADVPLDAARAAIEQRASTIVRQQAAADQQLRALVTTLNRRLLGSPTNPAWMAFSAAGFLVLIISCANVANLLLARSTQRRREIAVRAALGASRFRVVRQLLVESAVLAGAGAVVAAAVSIFCVHVFASGIPDNALPYWSVYEFDLRVFAALVVVSAATVFIFGFVPAVQASRTDVNRVLKGGARGNTGAPGSQRWMTAFLAAEVALSVVLLSYGVIDLQERGPGLATDAVIFTSEVMTASLTLPADRYRAPEQRTDFYRRLMTRAAAIPGMGAFALAANLPARGAAERRIEVDRVAVDAGVTPAVWTLAVGERYFECLGLPMRRGREFAAADALPGRDAAIVNDRFVELFLAGGDAIGRRVRMTAAGTVPNAAPADGRWLTIVGVAPSIQQRLSDDPHPLVYTPLEAAGPPTIALLFRGRDGAPPPVEALRDELRTMDPNLPIYRVMSMAQAYDEARWVGRNSANLMRFLTTLALLLAIAGLYAITVHAVNQRTQELGIRVALGARPQMLRRLVLKRAAIQMSIGLVAGVACTVAWEAAFFTGRVDVRFARPEVLAPVAAILACAMLLACLGPARRAARLDPIVALRQE